jgi:hypothetical protein
MRYPIAFTKTLPHGSEVDHLDRGRAELYLTMFAISELKSEADVVEFVGGLFEASRGNPDVKALLLDAPFDWLPSIAAEALSSMLETFWNEFQQAPPTVDGLRTLREMCLRQKHGWPATMVAALFDEPCFDAVAYVDFDKTSD